MRFLLILATIVGATGRGCFQRWDREKNEQTAVYHANSTTMLCKDIVQNPRQPLARNLCLCVDGKWLPLDYGGYSGSVDVEFFGDILGAARKLCAIVDSIDCIKEPTIGRWVLDPTNFSLIGANASGAPALFKPELKRLVSREGETRYIDRQNVMSIIEDICKFIDDGAGTIPGLLPDRDVDGIFGWIGRFIDGLFDFFDIFNNGMIPASQLYSAYSPKLRRT